MPPSVIGKRRRKAASLAAGLAGIHVTFAVPGAPTAPEGEDVPPWRRHHSSHSGAAHRHFNEPRALPSKSKSSNADHIAAIARKMRWNTYLELHNMTVSVRGQVRAG